MRKLAAAVILSIVVFSVETPVSQFSAAGRPYILAEIEMDFLLTSIGSNCPDSSNYESATMKES